jgi:DNA-binding MarR family transcriptional regulator
MPALTTPPVQRVTTLRMVTLRLTRRLRRHSGIALTPSQLSALSALERHGPMALGRLAEHEQIGKSTLTRLISRLEELDLVDRERGDPDGRSWVVALTEEGKRLSYETGLRADAYLARQIAALDPKDQKLINEALPALERLLEVKA